MSAFDVIRVANMVVWLAVAFMRLPSIYRVLRGHARYYDIMAAMISSVGFLIVGFNARWFLPPSNGFHFALYVFSIMLAFSIIRVLSRYESATR